MNITNLKLGKKYLDKYKMMNALAQKNFCVEKVLSECDSELIATADQIVFSVITPKVKDDVSDLSFKEAFSGMLLVIAATNNPIREKLFPRMAYDEAISKGSSFLTLMAMKECREGLSSEEIAGMSAAGTLDLIFRPFVPKVIETCGMGGDRSWGAKEIKTINASTLSAFVLASLGIPTFKHGSYGNTTKVGSTDIPINFGIQICHHSKEQILNLFNKTNFWFSDAHSVKTLHYLSHLLMVETVNHIVGPMTVPISKETKLFKVIGVNHHVNPETIARAYTILHQKRFVNLGGVIVICGLDEIPKNNQYLDRQWVKQHAFLDEVSPKATLISLAKEDKFLGNFVLTDENFSANPLREESLKVKNTVPSLMRADEAALSGKDRILSDYLARNAAIGLLVFNGLNETQHLANLPYYYQKCLNAIYSGQAFQALKKYVRTSGGRFKDWL